MRQPARLMLIVSLWIAGTAVQALENRFNFNALTLQQGDGFEVGESHRRILTLEHYSLWDWGDLYAFYDRIHETSSGHRSDYAEISPRLSLSLLGLQTRRGPFRDLLFATTFETGSGGHQAVLGGLGATWDLPPFNHLETDLYYRDTRTLDGATWQLTLVWSLPFRTGPLHWVLDGYLDTRGSEGDASADLNFNPQLKFDLGRLFDLPDHLYAGIEYYHWNNKFGIDGVHERVVSPLLQFRFSL